MRGLLLLLLAGMGQAAAPVPAEGFRVSFSFERLAVGVPVPRYRIELRGDGTGEYRAEVPVAQAGAPAPAGAGETRVVERRVAFTRATVASALEAVKLLRAGGACVSKAKNIASSGTKTLAYRGLEGGDAEGEGGCVFDYTENKGAMALTELFRGVEYTLEEGRALDFKHRYDRLGLDAEMASLASQAEGGKALELGNIAPTLRSIADDTELIQRVRFRAAKLLDQAGTER